MFTPLLHCLDCLLETIEGAVEAFEGFRASKECCCVLTMFQINFLSWDYS